jgi:hypothetical protein
LRLGRMVGATGLRRLIEFIDEDGGGQVTIAKEAYRLIDYFQC